MKKFILGFVLSVGFFSLQGCAKYDLKAEMLKNPEQVMRVMNEHPEVFDAEMEKLAQANAK